MSTSTSWSRPSICRCLRVATKIPEVVEDIPQERIWCMFEGAASRGENP